MLLEELDKFINYKMNTQGNFVKFSFYEMRVKMNLNEQELQTILGLAKNKLENNGYKVYFTGQEYTYAGIQSKVKSNELLIAVK